MDHTQWREGFKRLKTHALHDPIVQATLAGFLESELRARGVKHITADDLRKVLGSYVTGINTRGADMRDHPEAYGLKR